MPIQKEVQPKRKSRQTLPIDELNQLSGYDYDLTDRYIAHLSKLILRGYRGLWVKIRNRKPKETIQRINTFFEEMYDDAYEDFLEIAQKQYKAAGGTGKIDSKWLDAQLNGYDPVMKRVWNNEAERKNAVLIESVMSSDKPNAEIGIRMREWSRFVNQGALNITDAAVKQAYEDRGIERVMWVTQKDEKVCDECMPRHGVIYALDAVPTRHPNCRCILVPMR